MEQAAQVIYIEALHIYRMDAVCEHLLYPDNLSAYCKDFWGGHVYKDNIVCNKPLCHVPVPVGTAQEEGQRRCI